MSYDISKPEENIEYFFNIKDRPDLSHVIFMLNDENNFPIFFNLDTHEITFTTQRQFSFFYSKFMEKAIKSTILTKKLWLMFNEKYQIVRDSLKEKSDIARLLSAFCNIPFIEQRKAIIEFAEGRKLKCSLSEDEKQIIEIFRKLGPFEREAIMIQIKALAEEKSVKSK